MIIDNQTIEKVEGIITKQDFYSDHHQKIFNIILKLNKKTAIDIITLCDVLRGMNQLDTVGGTAYIASLVDDIPSAANIEYYAHIVKENSLRRQLLSKAYEVIDIAYSTDDNINNCIDKAQKEILSINPFLESGFIKSSREVVETTFKEIEERYETRGVIITDCAV
ncbi:MAG: DnaB-like helicase N-terminal domain-containing protein, partial [Smithella sp.]